MRLVRPTSPALPAVLLVLLPLASVSFAAGAGRQHIVVNIAPGQPKLSVFRRVQELGRGGAPGFAGLGVAAIFSYLHQPPETTRGDLREFLSLAERFDVPIVVQLDGEQWWADRPDLWNWWDPDAPGYDPGNRGNVEWSGWGPEHAIKIAWRNWGRQIRVLPPPNLASERYRRACHEEMRVLVPLVLDWWRGLPAAKRDLLIGIKLGWESSIGVNSFHYPGGNQRLDQPEKDDPRTGLDTDRIPDRGVAAIGYAAVSTAGLATSGELREADLARVVQNHLGDLSSVAASLGVPRDRLFTHAGGWKDGELLYDAALNRWACPGWSFYRHAADPAKDRGVERALRASDAPAWAAVEWLLPGAKGEREWYEALDRTLSDPRCRYVCVYNWSSIRDHAPALDAIRAHAGCLQTVARSDDGADFVLRPSGERFVAWGVNYDHDDAGRLLEDYWRTEWPTVVEDLGEIRDLGANVVRIHLQVGRFMTGPRRTNEASLEQLARLVRLAERTGLYLDVTGLGCYHERDVPAWYDAMPEAERWAVQARFWEAVARTCADSPAIFCYDLMNEPILPGAGRTETEWLTGELGGKHFVQRISLDLAGRTREQVARAWIDRLVGAIRRHDERHLVTVGVIPWAHVFPGARPLFHDREVGAALDFVSVHFYPERGRIAEALKALAVYDVGKPLVVEEMFPLKCGPRELEEFIDGSRGIADGYISFYWGKRVDEYAKGDDLASALIAEWLRRFRSRSPVYAAGRSAAAAR